MEICISQNTIQYFLGNADFRYEIGTNINDPDESHL